MASEIGGVPEPPTSSLPSLPQNYQALDSGRFQIRRFSLAPGEFEGPIRGTLDIVSLDSDPEYEALSYVWGLDPAPSPMMIGETSVPITRNLDTALRHLRRPDSSLVLWIDAICINQTDLKEKADQVKHMGLIYSQAKKAIVWLGNADESFEPVSYFLEDLHIQREQLQSFASELKEVAPRRSKPSQNDPEFALALRAQSRPTSVLRGLLELFSRPYWERVWIVQEISKASDVEINFGRYRVDLDPLLLASRNLKNLSERTRTLLRAIVRFRAQEQGYGGLSTSARMSLFDALITSRYSLATDPRDKVYALLGLTSDGLNLVPLPTYASSVPKVFAELTTAMIKSQQPSNVLLLANWAPLHDRSTEINRKAALAALTLNDTTKWDVDWADLGHHLPPWLTKLPRSTPKPISSRVDFNASILVTKGRYITTITEVQGKSRAVGPASPSARGRPPKHSAATPAVMIMNQVSSDLLERLAPGFRSTTLLRQTVITDALARMIRDVNKGETSADYDMNCVEDVLEHLGRLSWKGNPIWEWARQYNHVRASDLFDEANDLKVTVPEDGNNSTASAQTPTQVPTSPLSWLRDKIIYTRDVQPAADPTLTPPSTQLQVPWSPQPQAPPMAAFRFWEDVLSALDTVPEFKLRFAVAVPEQFPTEAHLVLVCDAATLGDRVYQIENSNLPVVLRRNFGWYDFIGDVCTSRQATGEWNQDRFGTPTDDPFKTETKNQQVETLNIRLDQHSHPRSLQKSLYGSLYEN